MKIKNIKLANLITDMFYQKFKIYVFYKNNIMSDSEKYDLQDLENMTIFNIKDIAKKNALMLDKILKI